MGRWYGNSKRERRLDDLALVRAEAEELREALLDVEQAAAVALSEGSAPRGALRGIRARARRALGATRG